MIRISELEKRYGSLRAVDGISFSVGRGEVMGFLGPNGAGKTTTMRMIAGFLPPDSGQVTIDDIDVVRNPQAAQALLGYLPEGAPSYPEMTPVQFLRFCGQTRSMPRDTLKKAIDVAVERTGLGDVTGQTIGTLSKGYRRRVGIAQAILHDPPALILDEPTDGLDPNQKHAVRKLIQAMAPEKAIIISTHILEEVDAVCTRAAIIAHGKILADTTPDALAETAPGHGDIRMEMDNGTAVTASRHLIKHPLIADLTAISGDDNNVAFVIRPKGGQVILPELVALSQRHGWPLRSLSVRRGKLEDVFRAVTRPDGPMPRKLDADQEQEKQP